MFDVKEILVGMSPYVQFISFGLLFLSGLNTPISEDIVIIVSASIAATIARHNMLYIFAGCLLGAYLGDNASYCIGRFLIKKVLYSRLLIRLKLVNPVRMESRIGVMRDYFLSYGGKTLFFGRFIPFGFRNVLFMTCGFIKMNPVKFMIIDLCAVTSTTLILFSLGYTFGNNYEMIFPYLNRYKFVVMALIIAIIVLFIARKKLFRKKTTAPNGDEIDEMKSKNAIIK
jgi:membrane-associated protein